MADPFATLDPFKAPAPAPAPAGAPNPFGVPLQQPGPAAVNPFAAQPAAQLPNNSAAFANAFGQPQQQPQ